MTEKNYQELNDYLSDIWQYLYDKDWVLLNNIEVIARFNAAFRSVIKDYDLKRDYKQNHITFNEVYLLAREIIETINPKYLEDYDNLLSSGELDFDYENELRDSRSMHIFTAGKSFDLIDIKRDFNYEDVVTLIHEYIHYTNGKINEDLENRHMLTEYVSIYFEMYARDYLINKGIPKEEFYYNDRIISAYNYGLDITDYELIFISYQKYGKITEETYKDLNASVINIPKEMFEKECKKFLEKCKKLDKEYQHDILYEADFNHKKYSDKLTANIDTDYRYLFGTAFAIYTRELNDIDSVIKLNDNLNNEMLSLDDLLKMVHIDFDNPSLRNDLLSSLTRYLEKYNNKVIK